MIHQYDKLYQEYGDFYHDWQIIHHEKSQGILLSGEEMAYTEIITQKIANPLSQKVNHILQYSQPVSISQS